MDWIAFAQIALALVLLVVCGGLVFVAERARRHARRSPPNRPLDEHEGDKRT